MRRHFHIPFYLILFATLSMHAFFPSLLKAGILDDIKREIQQKEAEVLQLEAEKKQYEGTITQKRTQQRTLQNTIAALNAEISRLQVQQKITVTQISSTELSIRALGTQINQAESAIAKNLYRIGAVLRTLHEQAETHRTLVSLMLANQPLSAFLGQLTYTQSLEEELFDQTQLLTKTKKDLEGEKTSLQTEQQRLEELHDRLVAENGAKNSQQKQKNQLLTSTRNEEKRYQQLLKDAEKQRLEILKDIKELEDKLRRTIDPESIPAFRPGVLEWPAKGIMSQAYGNTSDTGFINDAYEFHNGIDVANHTGTPIRSARDGVIKAIGNNSPYAYGRWIAVEHDNNLTTLYAHLSSYAAGMRVGTAVKTGQAIAYMGATGYATGPHLHFTVYASNTFLTQDRWFGLLPLGGTINPQKYLP